MTPHTTTPGPRALTADRPLRPVLLATRNFADVLDYRAEWEQVTPHTPGRRPGAPSIQGRPIAGKNVLGPLCVIDLRQIGGPAHRPIAALPTQAVIEALHQRIVTGDDQLDFKAIAHEHTGRVLIIASHSQICGDHWLAYVDADTIPPNPYRQRDERVSELCRALRDQGHDPVRRRLAGGAIKIKPDGPEAKINAIVDALGTVTLQWADGSTSSEQPCDPEEAQRAAAQPQRVHPTPVRPAARADERAAPPAQTTLFGAAAAAAPTPLGAPVRRSTVAPDVLDVLRRAQVDGDLVTLPGELERSLYAKVNQLLVTLGGKWNRHRGGHAFPAGQPLEEELAEIIDGGVLERTLSGYFPTPRALAEHLVAVAGVRPVHLVLEPSAGRGAIADVLRELVPAPRLYLLERDPAHHAALEHVGYRAPQLICDDFLTTTALPAGIERIVMNPPFENRQDIAHINRAYRLLAPGGRLAAVAAMGLVYRSDAATRALRELINANDGGSITENPPDTFKTSGTTVATVTIALTKSAA